MKKLKEFMKALIFILCVILDCIIYPLQHLLKYNTFQITQKYLTSIETKINK